MRHIINVGSALAIFLSLAAPCPAGPLKAGAGRAVITPPHDMWMAGYASRSAPSDGKIHDLFAKAIALEDETGARVVFVGTDLLGLPRAVAQETAAIAQKKFNLPRESLMLSSSHTHCGPVILASLGDMYDMDEKQAQFIREYTAALPGLLAEAIGQAIKSLEPCTAAWGVGEAGFAVNRRQYTAGGIGIGVNPIGPVDHDTPAMWFKRPDGSTIALLFSYACHNTTLNFQKFCGDYAGFAQAYLEETLPGSTALFIAGCGGDQNPNPRGKVEQARQYGTELGLGILSAMRSPNGSVAGPLKARFKEADLALSPVPTREQLEAQLKDANVYIQRRAKTLLGKLDAGGIPASYPYPVQVVTFAQGPAMIALGGETVVDYSLRIKYEFGRSNVMVFGYANDVMAYIPSLRVLREGGYEGAESMIYYGFHGPWAPQIEETIMGTVHELLPSGAR